MERVTHIHALFTIDNQVLYGHLEEATRLSLASSTVTQSIMSAHCVAGDWEDEIDRINLIVPQLLGKELVLLP